MPFSIEMTGAQDYQRTIKMGLGGYPGTGKTLFASTAPQVFFVFFRDQPRIMSIADRYMPHTKVTNKLDDNGRLLTPVWDTLLEVVEYLDSERGKEYQSVVIDTGDELFQALKEGKKAQNRGKFAIQDWGWLGDTYREMINRIIDLPKHVIVTYHIKATQEGDDGEILREIALQGQAKDEVAGWFDIMGVLDSWEEDTQDGKVLHRGMLTHTTPRYQFVKDHSGKLPKVFELSENFVGDFERLHNLIYKDLPASEHEVLEVITVEKTAPTPETPKTSAETGVPTPEDVAAKKEAKKGAKKKDVAADESKEPDVESASSAAEGQETAEPVPEPAGPADAEPDSTDTPGDEADQETTPEAESKDAEADNESGSADGDVTTEEATQAVEEQLGGEVILATCEFEVDGEPCGKELVKRKVDALGNPMGDENGEPIMVPDTDLMDLTKIRFRKHMCREHFTQARKG